MRTWVVWATGAVLLAAGSAAVLSLTWGQEPAPNSEQFVLKPAAAPAGPGPQPQLPAAQQPLYLAAKAGKEWLLRVNRPNGRFLAGLVPELRVPVPGENYLHQAAAA